MQTRGIRSARETRRGVSGCWLAAGAVVLTALALGGCAVSKYNGIVTNQTYVEKQWSEIGNQYKRRFDLVPQLVETVKGAANFEQSTITAVTEARASVGKLQIAPGVPTDDQAMMKFLSAQQELGSSLSRLLVTVENYPELRATANFLSLQDQLEGNENRIAVARRDYIDAVQRYNAEIRKFPATLIAASFGFEKFPQLEFESESTAVPKVEFDFGNKSDGKQ